MLQDISPMGLAIVVAAQHRWPVGARLQLLLAWHGNATQVSAPTTVTVRHVGPVAASDAYPQQADATHAQDTNPVFVAQGTQQLRYGFEVSPSDRVPFAKACGQAMLMQTHWPTTPKTITERGFVMSSILGALEFRTATSADDLSRIHALRWQTYSEKDQISCADSGPCDMGDHFDARSWVGMVHYQKELVASFRSFLPAADDALEVYTYMQPGGTLPPVEHTLELGRVAIHAGFRGHDVLPGIMRLVARYALQNNRRYLLFAANERLATYYKRYAAQDTAVRLIHPRVKHGSVAVMTIDLWQLWQEKDAWAHAALFRAAPLVDGKVLPLLQPQDV